MQVTKCKCWRSEMMVDEAGCERTARGLLGGVYVRRIDEDIGRERDEEMMR